LGGLAFAHFQINPAGGTVDAYKQAQRGPKGTLLASQLAPYALNAFLRRNPKGDVASQSISQFFFPDPPSISFQPTHNATRNHNNFF
jgi:hypothetical protein